MLQKLNSLTVESEDFALVAKRAQRFCPFEAIGMVRQEIRHSNFLSYLLDPARPHELGAVALQALLSLLTDGELAGYQGSNLANARVWRERDHIDLLIEIPVKDEQGMVIAIEIKVDALEREAQLSDYAQKVRRRYPVGSWKHLFCFLTPDGRAGVTQGADEWQSLSFGDLLRKIELSINSVGLSGEGVKLFAYYHTMMKRHNIVQDPSDPKLEQAVSAIWAKHKETLDFLLAHRPDPVSDVLRELDARQTEVSSRLEKECRERIQADSKYGRYRRFSFPNLANSCPNLFLGNTGWVASGSQLVLELTVEQEEVVVSFCVGPEEDMKGKESDFRSRLIKEMNRVSGEDKKVAKGARHFWRSPLLTWSDFEDEDQKTHLKILEDKLMLFLETHLGDVRQAVQAACSSQDNK